MHVSYHYGFSADMGGGEYGRRAGTFTSGIEQPIVKVPSPEDRTTMQGGARLNSPIPGGVIEITNERLLRLETPVSVLYLPEGRRSNCVLPMSAARFWSSTVSW